MTTTHTKLAGLLCEPCVLGGKLFTYSGLPLFSEGQPVGNDVDLGGEFV